MCFLLAALAISLLPIIYEVEGLSKCQQAQICVHNAIERCGEDINTKKLRWFLDWCDMKEYNCLFEAEFHVTENTRCSHLPKIESISSSGTSPQNLSHEFSSGTLQKTLEAPLQTSNDDFDSGENEKPSRTTLQNPNDDFDSGENEKPSKATLQNPNDDFDSGENEKPSETTLQNPNDDFNSGEQENASETTPQDLNNDFDSGEHEHASEKPLQQSSNDFDSSERGPQRRLVTPPVAFLQHKDFPNEIVNKNKKVHSSPMKQNDTNRRFNHEKTPELLPGKSSSRVWLT